MKWILRITILSSAAFGAQQLYALVRPKATRLRDQVEPRVQDLVHVVQAGVDDLKWDATEVAEGVRSGFEEALSDALASHPSENHPAETVQDLVGR